MEGLAGNHKTHWIEGANHLTTLADPKYVADFTQALVAFLSENTPADSMLAAR
jgi:hypothetical protein